MLKSMTAFGRAQIEWEDKTITVELRSVNSRYFDCNVKLPRAYAAFEEKIKAYLQKNVLSRGKLDASVSVQGKGSATSQITLDEEYLSGYLAALARLRDEYGLSDDISVMKVAENREVFTVVKVEEDVSEDYARIEEVFALAARDHGAMRSAEGERIERDFKEKVENIRALTEKIAARSAEEIALYREKLEGRLRQVLAEHALVPDEARVLTECAIMADRLAVDEELVRLGSHFAAFAQILSSGEPAGRKLDFLMQEMNRETNTIGSKCSSSVIAAHVVDIKCELEKIREQIQNIE